MPGMKQPEKVTRRRASALAIISLAAVLCGCGKDETWWNEEWTMRKSVTVDTAAAGVTEPVDGIRFPLRLTEFAAGKEDGTDIRFIADDNKTELPFYLESY